MWRFRIGLGLCLCLLWVGQVEAQAFLPAYAKAYRLAFKLKADSAYLLTATPSVDQEAEAQRQLVRSLTDMVANMVSEGDAPLPGYDDRQEERIDALDGQRKPGPWARHALAECYLHRALVQGRYGHEVKAGISFYKAYTRTKSLAHDQPGFLPARKSMGVYLMILGLMPIERNFFMKLAGIRGDVDAGLADLRRCSDSANAQQAEATLLYSLAQMYVRDQPEQGRANLIRYVNNEYDDLLGLTLLANVYKEDHQNGRALAALNVMQREKGHLPFYFPLLLKGELHLQALELDSAIPPLEQYLTVCSRQRLVKQLHYKLFVAYFLKGDSLAANAHFYAIHTDGEIGTDGDRYAEYFYNRGLIPDKRLLRCRVLYDGGFYERAQRILDSIPPSSLPTLNELAELSYRRARLAQRRKDTTTAQRLFLLTISTAGDDPSYYAPMSCLQLGQIALRRRQFDEARTWLERVKTYPRHEYKDGLDERADHALKRLRRAERGKDVRQRRP